MKTKQTYIGFGVVLGIAIGTVLGGSLWAGLLEPPSEALPNGAPTSTMRPLDELQGSWSRTFPCDTQANCERFVPVLTGEAIRDRETGLVWEQSPNTPLPRQWDNALSDCLSKIHGSRMGWRLPTVNELTSLIVLDREFPEGSTPALPVGHPFDNLEAGLYWTINKIEDFPDRTWAVNMNFFMDSDDGSLTNPGPRKRLESDSLFVWCVRGGEVAVSL